jgi:hypothetical protein
MPGRLVPVLPSSKSWNRETVRRLSAGKRQRSRPGQSNLDSQRLHANFQHERRKVVALPFGFARPVGSDRISRAGCVCTPKPRAFRAGAWPGLPIKSRTCLFPRSVVIECCAHVRLAARPRPEAQKQKRSSLTRIASSARRTATRGVPVLHGAGSVRADHASRHGL